MKLSEAMRKGAAVSPPAKGLYFRVLTEHPDVICSCALGAAAIGAFDLDPSLDSGWTLRQCSQAERQLFETYYILFTDNVAAPVSDLDEDSLHTIIAKLNDEYNWTREQIADWLQSIGY